jgi:hypothetical protein
MGVVFFVSHEVWTAFLEKMFVELVLGAPGLGSKIISEYQKNLFACRCLRPYIMGRNLGRPFGDGLGSRIAAAAERAALG